MIGILLAALASTAAAEAESTIAAALQGHCSYSEAIVSRSEGAVLVTCDNLEIAKGDEGATFDFGLRSWGSMLRFHGSMAGDRLKVDRITLRNGKSVDAAGTCEIFRHGRRLSVVSCLATARGQPYAANFVPTRS